MTKLIETRQNCAVDPMLAAAAGPAVGIGAKAAGTFLSKWMWRRYEERKARSRKKKDATLDCYRITLVDTIEERIVKTRRHVTTCIVLKPKG
ncbi:MAG: hypothetical protein WA817_14405 [Candidatus Acidiferrum sp.]